MKKVLLGTSAIALVGAFATTAQAAEWEIEVGGYAEQFIAYGSSDFNDSAQLAAGTDGEPDVDGVDIESDTEVHFDFGITLDNGIKFGAQVELEGDAGSGGEIDESEIFVRGSFGQFVIGNEDPAGNRMVFVAPDVSIIGANSGTMSAYVRYDLVADNLGRTLDSTISDGWISDSDGITYFTPRLFGVQLGASYFRSNTQSDGLDDNDFVDYDNTVSLGANYVNSFAGVDVALSSYWMTAEDDTNGDPEIFGFGANFGYAGFTLGGSWGEVNDEEFSSGASRDGNAFDIGISYSTGPFNMSFVYVNGDANHSSGGEEELQLFKGAFRYNLAQGVDLTAEAGYADYSLESTTTEFSDAEIDGFFIGTGIDLSF
ncbi:MAG: porin [Pseudomonadota bacterium]